MGAGGGLPVGKGQKSHAPSDGIWQRSARVREGADLSGAISPVQEESVPRP